MSRYKRKESTTQKVLFFMGLVMALVWTTGRVVGCVTYDIEVGDRLKRASDANSIELATQELDAALRGIKSRRLTTGYTSILYRTPDEDLSFWYRNIVSAQQELVQLPKDSTPLEKTNVLMKLRETLLDSGESGPHVTAPSGISIYPNNTLYSVLGTIGWVFFFVFGFWWFHREAH